ncbi:hypothetical protein BpHYR1_039505 [Brachionus plicatilis]|uniref:Uncharacterized protein n=1 Tax=Brachionus plicatilis TaxID=10195 RepID=A0A3M7Q7Y1_BRAPC|nr:hypothetical protein BpHYR1_039505 [Brachionus plicatilis]
MSIDFKKSNVRVLYFKNVLAVQIKDAVIIVVQNLPVEFIYVKNRHIPLEDPRIIIHTHKLTYSKVNIRAKLVQSRFLSDLTI